MGFDDRYSAAPSLLLKTQCSHAGCGPGIGIPRPKIPGAAFNRRYEYAK